MRPGMPLASKRTRSHASDADEGAKGAALMATRANPVGTGDGSQTQAEPPEDQTLAPAGQHGRPRSQDDGARGHGRPGGAPEGDVATLDPPAADDAAEGRADELRRRLSSGEAAVVATDISRKFGDQEVVRNLSFEVKRGTIFGIIGPSGGGKTTTMRMLLGVLRTSTGELRVLDRDPARFRRRDRERLGYMPQLFVLFPELSVAGEHGLRRVDLWHGLLRAKPPDPPRPGACRPLGRTRQRPPAS